MKFLIYNMLIIQAGKNVSKQYGSVLRLPSSSKIHLAQRYRSTEISKEQIKPPAADRCSNPPKPPPKDRCSDPPKVERNPLSRKLFAVSSFALAGTAIAVYGAKNDDDFRDWTKENLPALDNLVKVVYQEEETYGEFVLSVHKGATEGLKSALYSIALGIKDAGKKTRDPVVDPPKIKKGKDLFKSPDSAFAIEDGNSKSTVPENLKHLKELEAKLFKDAQETLQAHNSATEAVRESANFIGNLDQMVSKHDCKLWDRFRKRSEDLNMLIEKFNKGLEKVKESAEYLQFQMDRTPELSLDMRHRAESNIRYTVETINKAKETLNKDINNETQSKLSFDKMRVARMYFYDQLETFIPNVGLDDEKLIIPMDNMPPFIESVIQNIKVAEKDMNKLQTILESEVTNVTKVTRKSELDLPTNDIIDIFVRIESEKEKRLQREELQKALHINKAKCDKSNRESLKQLTEVYSDLKSEALAVREREVERRMEQQLEKELAEQRASYQLEMAKMVGRIQGANEAIASRDGQEKGQQGKQQFWSAAQNLVSAVKQLAVDGRSKELKPIKNEILNVIKAAPNGDELVKSVVDSIPSEVIERGVASEECLKNRFLQVEKEARHLASVPTGQITLFQLALARIQSTLYIDLPISESELKNEPIDVEELNNYQLLQRAKYYVDHGDLDQAVKYLNLLKGPSGMVASGWAKDVVNYMETVQGAEVLLAYASALNQ